MKYVYCENCDKAYLKSRLERDKCIYCGKASEIVDVKRNRLYYAGYGTMVVGAILMVAIRFLYYNLWLLWIVGLVFIITGGFLILKGNGEMAVEAKRLARDNMIENNVEESPDTSED